jgi:hypothetical protein
MPNLPWDLLAGRLGRYLQLSYISAVIAGFCLVGEIVVRNLKGTPAQRRQRIATAISSIGGNHRNFWVVALLIVISIVLAYVIGASMRYLVQAAYSFVYTSFSALFFVTGLTRKWFLVKQSLRTRIAPEEIERTPQPAQRHLRRVVTVSGQEFNIANPLGAIAYVWTAIRRYPTGKQLWEVLTNVYGEERVISALASHPIPVPIEHPWQVSSVVEYCRLWLNKYTPDMAVTTAATGYLIASTVFIPVLFLQGSLLAAFGTTAQVHRWAWLWPIVTLLLLYLIVTSPRAPRTTFQLFFRFVTVQLIEQSRGTTQDQAKSASENGAIEGHTLSTTPAKNSQSSQPNRP